MTINNIINYGTACAYNTIKAINTRAPSTALQDVLEGRKPDYLEDSGQEYLTALVQYGIDLSQPIHCIQAQSRAIVYTTRNGSERTAYQMAALAVQRYIRNTANGQYTTAKRIDGKLYNVPCLALDAYQPGTEYRDGLSYQQDMQQEDTIRAAHIAIIKANSKPKHHEILSIIYTYIVDGYTQRNIAAMLAMPTSTVNRHVTTIRNALTAQLATLDTLTNRHN